MRAVGSIVCGVDGSANSAAAVAVAARMAKGLGLRLVLAHVIELPEPAYVTTGVVPAPAAGVNVDEQLRAGERLVEELANNAGVGDAERRVVPGFAAQRLADVADTERAELLVVGSRGRGAIKSALLGSVSMNLIGLARVPVLVVPPGAAAPSLN